MWKLIVVVAVCLVGAAYSYSQDWPPVRATGTECVMLGASAINCDTTDGCAITDTAGTVFDYSVAAFLSAADDFGAWSFIVPNNIEGSTFAARVFWHGSHDDCDNGSDTSTDVCWTLASAGIANTGAWESATLPTHVGVVDRCIDDGELLVSDAVTITHGWSANEVAVVELSRDIDAGIASCATDDYLHPALLLGVEICYGVRTIFSGGE